jgi:hypothetical protein
MTIGTGRILSSFGSLFESSAGTDIVIVTPGTFVKWVSSTVGNQSGGNFVVGSAVTDDMTIGKYGGGDYKGKYIATVKLDHNQCVIAALFKNGVKIDESEHRLTSPGPPKLFADSITLNNGTLISGTVADTRNFDGVFYNVQETGGAPGFQYDIQFTDVEKLASIFEAIFIYDVASTAHIIKAQAYNRDTTSWVDITSDTKDFPPLQGLPITKRFKIPGTLADYYNAAGEILIRLDHTSPGNTGHHFKADEFSMVRDVPSVILSGSFNQPLVEGDVIDLRFTCPINAKTITVTTVNVDISRDDK